MSETIISLGTELARNSLAVLDTLNIEALAVLRTVLRSQLHPKPEPRVGDVKHVDGCTWIRWGAGDHRWHWIAGTQKRADKELANCAVLFNIKDELDAREKGPVVDLTEELATVLIEGAGSSLELTQARNRIEKALAEYRKQQKEST